MKLSEVITLLAYDQEEMYLKISIYSEDDKMINYYDTVDFIAEGLNAKKLEVLYIEIRPTEIEIRVQEEKR